MTRARDIANLVDANGDIVAGALDNVPASNDASALTTGTLDVARLGASSITAAKLSDTYLTGVTASNLPSGSIVKTQIDQSDSTLSYTNSDGDFFVGNNFTKTASANPLIISGSMCWGGDNPNGYWALQSSDDNGSTWSLRSDLFERDEASTLQDLHTFTFSYEDTTNVSARRYKVYWYHGAKNGGTMYRNRVYTQQSWSSGGRGLCSMTIMEIKA